MNIYKMIEEVQNGVEYQKILLEKEINRYNERAEEDDQIDIYQVRNAMNNYNDIQEIKSMIEELKNR